MIKTITSLTNPAVKKVVTLHTSKGRAQHQEYIVEGIRSLEIFVQAQIFPVELYCLESMVGQAQTLFKKTVVTVVPEHVLEKMSASHSPAGLLAVFSISESPKPEKLTSGIVLANLQDPGNVGTLIRSAVAFGYKSAIIIGGCDPYSPKVVQATAGTLAHIQMFNWTWQQLLQHKNKLTLCALVVDSNKAAQATPAATTLFVVGNEAHGLPEKWVTECDVTLTIPLSPQAESLNAAVAGSIALYRGIIDKV